MRGGDDPMEIARQLQASHRASGTHRGEGSAGGRGARPGARPTSSTPASGVGGGMASRTPVRPSPLNPMASRGFQPAAAARVIRPPTIPRPPTRQVTPAAQVASRTVTPVAAASQAREITPSGSVPPANTPSVDSSQRRDALPISNPQMPTHAYAPTAGVTLAPEDYDDAPARLMKPPAPRGVSKVLPRDDGEPKPKIQAYSQANKTTNESVPVATDSACPMEGVVTNPSTEGPPQKDVSGADSVPASAATTVTASAAEDGPVIFYYQDEPPRKKANGSTIVIRKGDTTRPVVGGSSGGQVPRPAAGAVSGGKPPHLVAGTTAGAGNDENLPSAAGGGNGGNLPRTTAGTGNGGNFPHNAVGTGNSKNPPVSTAGTGNGGKLPTAPAGTPNSTQTPLPIVTTSKSGNLPKPPNGASNGGQNLGPAVTIRNNGDVSRTAVTANSRGSASQPATSALSGGDGLRPTINSLIMTNPNAGGGPLPNHTPAMTTPNDEGPVSIYYQEEKVTPIKNPTAVENNAIRVAEFPPNQPALAPVNGALTSTIPDDNEGPVTVYYQDEPRKKAKPAAETKATNTSARGTFARQGDGYLPRTAEPQFANQPSVMSCQNNFAMPGVPLDSNSMAYAGLAHAEMNTQDLMDIDEGDLVGSYPVLDTTDTQNVKETSTATHPVLPGSLFAKNSVMNTADTSKTLEAKCTCTKEARGLGSSKWAAQGAAQVAEEGHFSLAGNMNKSTPVECLVHDSGPKSPFTPTAPEFVPRSGTPVPPVDGTLTTQVPGQAVSIPNSPIPAFRVRGADDSSWILLRLK